MNHTIELSGESGILAVSEALTIEDAEELKKAVTDALAAATHLLIDLSRVTAIDLCCLQVLCSAHRTAVTEGKTFALLNSGDGFLETIRETGYLRHMGCLTTRGHDCLWIDTTGENAEADV
jgi:anti-anti-sigma factor